MSSEIANTLGSLQVYPIVITDSPAIPVGAIVYQQTGVQGTPIGLALAITNTPTYYKAIKTQYGIKKINL